MRLSSLSSTRSTVIPYAAMRVLTPRRVDQRRPTSPRRFAPAEQWRRESSGSNAIWQGQAGDHQNPEPAGTFAGLGYSQQVSYQHLNSTSITPTGGAQRRREER